MADLSISRVYQFLTDFNKENGDWRDIADKNNDGVVIKTEFRNFMLNNYDWNGEDSNKDDLINKFWKNIDTDTSGKIAGKKNVKNKNALDSNELDKMDTKIQIFEKMNEFVKENVNPADSGVSNKSAWLKSVKESLGSYIDQFVKNGGTVDNVEEFLNQKLPVSKAMATANLYIQEYLKSDEIKSLVPSIYKGQGTIQKIIDAFVQSLKEDDNFTALSSDSERLSYIKSKAEEIVKAYLATADLTSADPKILEEYGYYTGGDLNDIQEAVLVETMGKSIESYLQEKEPDIYTKSNKEALEAAINNFIDKKLEGAEYDDFARLKNFDPAEIEDDDDFLALISELKDTFEELSEAKQSLKDYCAELVAKNNEDINNAIKKVFGSMDYEAKIDKCKDIAAVQALEDKLRARIDELDMKIDSSDLTNLTVSVYTGSGKMLDMPKTFTSVTGELVATNNIEYNVSGSHLEITNDGIKVNGGEKTGTFVEVVDVYINGKKAGQVKVTINVEDKVSLIKKGSFDGAIDKSGGHLDVFNCNGIEDDTQVRDSNFADLYDGDAIICLHRGHDDEDGLGFDRLSFLGDMIQTALVNAGLDSTILKKAISIVTTRYKDNYHEAPGIRDNREGCDLCRYIANNMQGESPEYSAHAIIGLTDHDGWNSYACMVSFKNFVDDILDEYDKLNGSV